MTNPDSDSPPPSVNESASVYDVDFPDYGERPCRRVGPTLDWGAMMEGFAPFVRAHYERRAADPEAHREKYRITETERFEM